MSGSNSMIQVIPTLSNSHCTDRRGKQKSNLGPFFPPPPSSTNQHPWSPLHYSVFYIPRLTLTFPPPSWPAHFALSWLDFLHLPLSLFVQVPFPRAFAAWCLWCSVVCTCSPHANHATLHFPQADAGISTKRIAFFFVCCGNIR